MAALTVDLPEELLDLIATRAAEKVLAEREAPAEDAWLRGADRIAEYIDAKPSRVYALNSAKRIPVHKDGSLLIARRSELDQWLLAGGGKRP